MNQKKYRTVALGGTFDHFHKGHEAFLLHAASLADHLIIGLTHPSMTLKKEFSSSIQSYKIRHKNLTQWCKQHDIAIEIIELQDTIGTTVSDSSIQALVVTENTLIGAKIVNKARAQKGKTALPIEIAPFALDETGAVISSTRIRSGEISTEGKSYYARAQKIIGTELTAEQRDFFGRLQGVLVKKPSFESKKRWLVGDVTLSNFLANQWDYAAAFFDLSTHRDQPISNAQITSLEISMEIKNEAGYFSEQLLEACQEVLKSTEIDLLHIKVTGEEDLATVLLVILGPLDAVLYYGQPDRGMVELVITEKKKDLFLSQF